MIATSLGVDLRVPEASELGAAFGAARLALIAESGESPESVLTSPRIKRVISPVQNLAPAYADAYDTWLSVMPEVRRASVALGNAA
jgi:xylulokinase